MNHDDERTELILKTVIKVLAGLAVVMGLLIILLLSL
jgi:hypothetical protein